MSFDLPTAPPLFDQALERAVQFIQQHLLEPPAELAVTLVRDVFGRLRIALDDRKVSRPERDWAALATELHRLLGAYSAGSTAEALFLWASDWLSPQTLFLAPERRELPQAPGIFLLERQVTGQDWLRPPLSGLSSRPRATVFGIKGGVGRSTALAVWARHLATKKRKRVLVVDLDLESPGVGALLLPKAALPRHGLVDFLIEAAVGQGSLVLSQLAARSPIVDRGPGEVLVVPAHGEKTGDYLAKLSRVYQGVPDGPQDFAERLVQALCEIEARHQPDVVLLDSRAGLHDIASVALTRLGALALLFAAGSQQTLSSYQLLFDRFRQQPDLLFALRPNLQAVAALVPPTDRAPYMDRLNSDLHRLFAESVYDQDVSTAPAALDPSAASLAEPWNFSLHDDTAPHNPIPIYWYQWFLDFDPVGRPETLLAAETDAAFGAFVERATALLLKE